MSASGSARLEAAFINALDRLEAVAALGGPPDNVFVPLGEALFWLYAFAEANGKGKRREVLAMTWARDHIAHGLIVVAPVTWDDGSGLARMLPSRRGYRWVDRAAVQPLRQPRSANRRAGSRTDAYDAIAVGRDMIEVVRAAFAAAGGIIP